MVEHGVGELLIQCPVTDEAVPTGTVVDDEATVVVDLDGGVVESCPACGGRHEWSGEDTFVADD